MSLIGIQIVPLYQTMPNYSRLKLFGKGTDFGKGHMKWGGEEESLS